MTIRLPCHLIKRGGKYRVPYRDRTAALAASSDPHCTVSGYTSLIPNKLPAQAGGQVAFINLNHARTLKKPTVVILVGWLLAGTGSLAWNLYDDYVQQEKAAFQTARTLVAQIEHTRAWLAGHRNGVYLPLDDIPAPFLPKDPEQVQRTTSGLRLARINPGYVLHELSGRTTGPGTATIRLIRLPPGGTNRTPGTDPMLDRLAAEKREVGAFLSSEGTSCFRYLAPLTAGHRCLTCHADSGYRKGDLLGAVAITITGRHPVLSRPMIVSHLAAMVIGSLIILLFHARVDSGHRRLLALNRDLEQEVLERREAERSLQAARDQLEEQVEQRTSALTATNRELQRKIHERERIEEALTTIYGEFYQLFNSAPDGMVVIDRHFQILRVNRAFTRLCGCSTNELMGQKCFDVFSGSTCHTPDCPLVRILKKEKRVEVEATKTLGSGRTIPCIVTATPFREPDGSLIGAIMVITDVSQLKQAEQALARTTRELQENNQALKDFAHSISHDLKEPLMLIQAFCRRLEKKVGDSTSCSRYIQIIDGAAGRMEEMVNGLLLYAKFSSRSEQFEPVNLTEILDTVLDDLALRIEQTGARIEAEPLPVIEAAPLQIRQLLQNLISNSLKYHRQGVRPEITICWSREETEGGRTEFVRLMIRDNGIGFASESRERIFDFCERLQTGDHPVEGSGIGLAICRRIVLRHGGTIEANSIPGQGAEFTVRLPARHCSETEKPPGAEPGPASSHDQRSS